MNITLGQYQELYAIHKSNADEIDKAVQSVSVLTGMSERQIEDMPVVEFNQLSKTVLTAFEIAKLNNKPSKELKANGKRYRVNYITNKLSAGQYIEVQEWLKGDVIQNADKILASICNEVKGRWFKKVKKYDGSVHQNVCNDMREVSFNDAYGSVVFFCQIFKGSIEATRDYLIKENPEKAKEIQKLMMDFSFVMDGYLTPKG